MTLRKSARAEVNTAVMPDDDPHAYAGRITVILNVYYPPVQNVTFHAVQDAITRALSDVAAQLVRQGLHPDVAQVIWEQGDAGKEDTRRG